MIRCLKETRFLVAIAAVMAMTTSGQAQVVTFSKVDLAADGSNLQSDGLQVSGIALENRFGAFDPVAGINWELNASTTAIGASAGDITGEISADFPGAAFGRNSTAGQPGAGLNALQQFAAGAGTNQNIYFDDGTGSESGLHQVIKGIGFGGDFDVSLTNLQENTDYRVQFISLDALSLTLIPGLNIDVLSRASTISSGADTLDFNQTLIDGVDTDLVAGSGADEVSAALITAEFTTLAGQDSIDFNFASRGGNDNAVVNAIAVHNLSAIPEPSSFAILAGIAGIGFVRRRR